MKSRKKSNKQRWLENTGIKVGDRVICLDDEARQSFRRENGLPYTPLQLLTGCVADEEYTDFRLRDVTLLIDWDDGDTWRVTPFWVLAKYDG